MQIVKVNGEFPWEIARSSEGNFVAVCRPLNLSMEGDTLEDLIANIEDGVQAMLRHLLETGELMQFFAEHGWSPPQVTGAPAANDVEFDVPIQFIMRRRDSARALLK